MRRKRYLLATGMLLLCLPMFSGCAFTVFQKNLNYAYSGHQLGNPNANPSKKLSIGNFEDHRDVTTPRMIMHMYNANGNMTTGGWEAEKPIADIVKDAMAEGARLSNLMTDGDGDFYLTGEVLDFTGSSKVNSSLGYSFSCKLTVKLKMKDLNTEKIAWSDTFIGQGSAKEMTHNGAHAVEGFRTSLDSVMEQVFNDEYFLQQFR